MHVVVQEPVLFARSVRRNICYGLEEEDGVPSDQVPSTADVERAARLANADDFISAMPNGYDTVRHCTHIPVYSAGMRSGNLHAAFASLLWLSTHC